PSAPSAPSATPAPASAPASAHAAASSGNPRRSRKKASGDFYRGAFDSIPFLNEDAKRTFTHLLLRPGYMIRDYIRGDHERYLAPLTALIVFYAFFALVFSILQPVQQKESAFEPIQMELQDEDGNQVGEDLLAQVAMVLQKGYTYLNLDQHPEEVHTQAESSLAALEGTLRSQGIPLFIGRFFLLWFALGIALRRYRMGMPAIAAASAYILCQFSFFMLFAVILTFGQSKSLGLAVMAAVMLIDLRQWLGETWKKSLGLTIRTGLWYAFLYGSFLLLVSAVVVLIAWIRGV
ncbi:MAG: DUF3667 domain-containing protein, partial [Bacteroidales bacterium]|nr:DUF3667 domain-containing protein [Bacteroidales bacterium]